MSLGLEVVWTCQAWGINGKDPKSNCWGVRNTEHVGDRLDPITFCPGERDELVKPEGGKFLSSFLRVLQVSEYVTGRNC